MSKIAVVDYGMGNLRSVAKALEHVAGDNAVVVTSDAAVIANAERVVFPGQGAARDCMAHLRERDLIGPVKQAAAEKPFLGICMGLQVLMTHSRENGGVDCMDVFAGEVAYFGDSIAREENGELLKIPHMGWNTVRHAQEHPLWRGIEDNSRFYFVHSYYVQPQDASLAAGVTHYGIDFVSAIARDNVFAIQAHPEKSAADGLQLLKNFVGWNGGH